MLIASTRNMLNPEEPDLKSPQEDVNLLKRSLLRSGFCEKDEHVHIIGPGSFAERCFSVSLQFDVSPMEAVSLERDPTWGKGRTTL